MSYDEKLASRIIDNQAAEIERLRAALKEISELRYTNTSAATIAQKALTEEMAL